MRLIDADKLDYTLKLAIVCTATSITDEGLKLARSFIKDAPTVQAIPIEWVKKWISERNDFPTMPYNQHIWNMLEDWEKENGK